VPEFPEELSEYHRGFVAGYLCAKGIQETPTMEQFRDALLALEEHLGVDDLGPH
jgi:hypothetical protein